MPKQISRFLICTMVLSGLLLVACASKPVLVAKPAVVPAGIDLSGYWRIRGAHGDRHLSAAGEELRIPTTRSHRSQREHRSVGSSVQVFLESGDVLKITQTPFSVFISYDRSVVEEYTFGENHLVSIGPITAQRVSGWEDGKFVVETLDDSGITLFESWYLRQDGAVLVRDIRISKGDKQSLVQQQEFVRQEVALK